MGWDRRLLVGAALAAAVAPGCAHFGDRSARLDDAAIATKVKARFLADATVSAMDVRVRAERGDVRLSGTARSREDADRAERLARSVAAVKVVENDIRLLPNR